MTASDVDSLMTPMGGFTVQQSLEAQTIQGTTHQDLK